MPISLQVRTLFILSLFSYPKMIIGNRPKLREDLSHVGFKSPHDFLEKKNKHLIRKRVIVYRIIIHIYLHREPSGVKL